MDPNERLNLKKLISESDSVDNTQHIRQVKHSLKMGQDIDTLERFKRENVLLRQENPAKFDELCESQCPFLFTNYTDIFRKLLKDEIDLHIMQKFLSVLKMIEDGKVDQHEGSVIVGKILKELYVDSAMRRGENLDKEHPPTPKIEGNPNLSWSDFKAMKK